MASPKACNSIALAKRCRMSAPSRRSSCVCTYHSHTLPGVLTLAAAPIEPRLTEYTRAKAPLPTRSHTRHVSWPSINTPPWLSVRLGGASDAGCSMKPPMPSRKRGRTRDCSLCCSPPMNGSEALRDTACTCTGGKPVVPCPTA
eukprot:scaffold6786_cov112-Isochrysis_galbana.AAC.6